MADAPVRPLEPDRWDDLVALFGPDRGAYGQCWCMWWRLTGREFDTLGAEGRRAAFQARSRTAPPPGLLAYRAGAPVGWVAVAPRGELGRLNRSPLLKPVDDVPVWAINCLFVAPAHRRTGLTAHLIEAAVDLATRNDAAAVEAYPRALVDGRAADDGIFTGTLDMFTSAGFVEVARRGDRPIVRRPCVAERSGDAEQT